MQKPYERYFYYAVAVSLILHSGLALLFIPEEKIKGDVETDQFIRVELVDASVVESPREDNSEKVSNAYPAAEKKIPPDMQTDNIIPDGEINVFLHDEDKAYSPYLRHVRKMIDSSWTYPYEALKRGVQGELTIFFSIEKKGTLADVRLIESSMHSELDSAAIKAVNDAAPFMSIPEGLKIGRMNIFASFVYRY